MIAHVNDLSAIGHTLKLLGDSPLMMRPECNEPKTVIETTTQPFKSSENLPAQMLSLLIWPLVLRTETKWNTNVSN